MAIRKKTKKTVKKVAKKAVSAKKTVKKVVKKAAPAKKAVKKSVPAKKTTKKAAPAKKAVKKATSARKSVKKAVPAKKATKKVVSTSKTTKKAPAKKKAVKKPAKKSVANKKTSKQVVDGLKNAVTQVQKKGKKKLTAADCRALKAALYELQERVVGEINFLTDDGLNRSKSGDNGDTALVGMHMADHGTDNFDREFALNLVSTEHDVLYEINQALHRIDDHTYGVCEACACRIEKARLEALPFARMCIRCKSEKEKGSVRFRPLGPTLSKR